MWCVGVLFLFFPLNSLLSLSRSLSFFLVLSFFCLVFPLKRTRRGNHFVLQFYINTEKSNPGQITDITVLY